MRMIHYSVKEPGYQVINIFFLVKKIHVFLKIVFDIDLIIIVNIY